MNIAERRKPQDGRIKAISNADGAGVDFRVNSVPTVFGEKLVLRLLDQSNLQVDLSKLGMEGFQMKILTKHLHKPQGMILFTGPTGSGKTTTIYSSLSDLNVPEKNITTAEDPVEYNLDGINQVQINPATGFRFPDALRAFLRQDPEIIMVGEVRDEETAEICYKAASTGHMVISTLHTNDAPSTVTRLVAMNQPTYMVAENTSLVVAQRLVKKICSKCKVPVKISEKQLIDIGVSRDELVDYENLYEGEGCLSCVNTGFAGREAVYEFLELTANIKKAISDRENALKLKKIAMKDGFLTLRQHALLKLRRGLIPLSEVINATIGDD